MRRLFHFPLSPSGRAVRLALAEKGVEAETVELSPWEAPAELAAMVEGAEAPAFVVGDRAVIGARAILEFLEEVGPGRRLLPDDPFERAETRRLVDHAFAAFHAEAVAPLIAEKIETKLRTGGAPDTTRMRGALAAAGRHLDLFEALLDRRRWLAGEEMTLADFAVAAELSVLDYLGDVPWDRRAILKEWYALMKSRPAFRGLLQDRLKGMPPAPQYQDLDF